MNVNRLRGMLTTYTYGAVVRQVKLRIIRSQVTFQGDGDEPQFLQESIFCSHSQICKYIS